MENNTPACRSRKQAGIAIFKSDKADIKPKLVRRDKEPLDIRDKLVYNTVTVEDFDTLFPSVDRSSRCPPPKKTQQRYLRGKLNHISNGPNIYLQSILSNSCGIHILHNNQQNFLKNASDSRSLVLTK
jgi:hypothetical protein